MAMKTLTELDAAEEAKRERARLYEVALDQQYRAKRNIEKLETLDAQAAVKSLTAMQTQLEGVPADLTTRGSRFIAGGFLVRELLTSIVGTVISVSRLNDLMRWQPVSGACKNTKRNKLALIRN